MRGERGERGGGVDAGGPVAHVRVRSGVAARAARLSRRAAVRPEGSGSAAGLPVAGGAGGGGRSIGAAH